MKIIKVFINYNPATEKYWRINLIINVSKVNDAFFVFLFYSINKTNPFLKFFGLEKLNVLFPFYLTLIFC